MPPADVVPLSAQAGELPQLAEEVASVTPFSVLERSLAVIEEFASLPIVQSSIFANELDNCRDACILIARAVTEGFRFLVRFEGYVMEQGASIRDVRSSWERIENKWFGNVTTFLNEGVSGVQRAMVALMGEGGDSACRPSSCSEVFGCHRGCQPDGCQLYCNSGAE